jgi:hypothetical protein
MVEKIEPVALNPEAVQNYIYDYFQDSILPSLMGFLFFNLS